MTDNLNLTEYPAKPISKVNQDYVDWLEAETGYPVDPITVQLASNLRGVFQKSAGNQKRIADAAAEKAAADAVREERRAAREAAALAKAAAVKAAPAKAPTPAKAKPAPKKAAPVKRAPKPGFEQPVRRRPVAKAAE